MPSMLHNYGDVSFEQQSLEVLPNPSDDRVEIVMELVEGYQMEIELFDQMGRKIKSVIS